MYPSKKKYRNGVDYEGKGMPPDIYMKNTIEEIENGQDKILEAAMNILNQNR